MIREGVNFFKVSQFFVIFFISRIQSCPIKCFCYLNEEPRRVLCSNQGLEVFPNGISDLVEHLDLSNNFLHSVPVDIGRLAELKYVNLSNNQLTGLPETIENLQKLQILDLSNNLISNNNEKILAIEKLSNLKILYLKHNPVIYLNNLVNIALKALDVSRCAITQINNNSLIGLPGLISLNLEGNPLTSVRYIKSGRLKWLNLSNCMLNLLHPNTFDNVPQLEQLRVTNNPMLVFSTRKETLHHLKLKRLDVSGCNLDRPGIHGLPSLTYAKFSRNTIRFLPDRIFSKNKMLTHLYLNDNGLNKLNGSSFDGIPKLEVLDLSGNLIDNLPEKLLKDNIHLQLFNLSYNDIKNIPEKFICSAITLDLSKNIIETILSDTLLNMPKIKNFNLSKNRLEFFDSGLSSSTLKTLILEGNRLVKLTNKSFANLPALITIDLSGNRLTEGINYDVFQYNPDLQTLFLHDNPWRCDCEQLHPTFYYLMRGSKTIASSLICQSPSNVSGYSWSSACYKFWNSNNHDNSRNNSTRGLIIMFLLIAFFLFGSCVSIGHTIKTKKRQAQLRLQEIERAEARERLIHHRRNRQMEELSRQENDNTPRVHPAELIGPPTYEEAVEMPRLVRSLENFNSILSIDGLGQSAQSFDHDVRMRKRRVQMRKRMMGKRAKSEDNLDSRRDDRIGNTTRINENYEQNEVGKIQMSSRRNRENSDESNRNIEDGSKRQTRLKTPNNNRKKRRLSSQQKYDGHSSDDEDSDVLRNSTVGVRRGVPVHDICVIDLPREPRSGTYRPPVTISLSSPPSSPDIVSSPESCDASTDQQHISRSEIV